MSALALLALTSQSAYAQPAPEANPAQEANPRIELVLMPGTPMLDRHDVLVQFLSDYFWNETVRVRTGVAWAEYQRDIARLPYEAATPSGVEVRIGEGLWERRLHQLVGDAKGNFVPADYTPANDAPWNVPHVIIGARDANLRSGVVNVDLSEISIDDDESMCAVMTEVVGYGSCVRFNSGQRMDPLDIAVVHFGRNRRVYRGAEADEAPFGSLGVRHRVSALIEDVIFPARDASSVLPARSVWANERSELELRISDSALRLIESGRVWLTSEGIDEGTLRFDHVTGVLELPPMNAGAHRLRVRLRAEEGLVHEYTLDLRAYAETAEHVVAGRRAEDHVVPLWAESLEDAPLMDRGRFEVCTRHVQGQPWLLVLTLLIGLSFAALGLRWRRVLPKTQIEALAFERDEPHYRESQGLRLVHVNEGDVAAAAPELADARAKIIDGVLVADDGVVIRDAHGVHKVRSRRLHDGFVGIWDHGARYVICARLDVTPNIEAPSDAEAASAEWPVVGPALQRAAQVLTLVIAPTLGLALCMMLHDGGFEVFGLVVPCALTVVGVSAVAGVIVARLVAGWQNP